MEQAPGFGDVSVVLPCRNEAAALPELLPALRDQLPGAEIVLVDDGSEDESADIARQNGIKVVSHPYSMGNGAAVKTGARYASGDVLVFMDADGQHDPGDVSRLLKKLGQGYDMVVGARSPDTHATTFRRIGNRVFNVFASWMTGHRIHDLTSGFRAVRARHFRKFLYLLPNGFSYPTTSTMAYFRSGLPVAYVPIRAMGGTGKSHISLFRDGTRFLLIILKIGALFSPMRLFLPISMMLFLLGMMHYGYNYYNFHKFTNMSALLLMASLFSFLIGILSEQISSLHYKGIDEDIGKSDR